MFESERGVSFTATAIEVLGSLRGDAEGRGDEVILAGVYCVEAQALTVEIAFDPKPDPHGLRDNVSGLAFVWYCDEPVLGLLRGLVVHLEADTGITLLPRG